MEAMFRPIGIPQIPPAPHPPNLRDRGSHTTDGTAAFFCALIARCILSAFNFICLPLHGEAPHIQYSRFLKHNQEAFYRRSLLH